MNYLSSFPILNIVTLWLLVMVLCSYAFAQSPAEPDSYNSVQATEEARINTNLLLIKSLEKAKLLQENQGDFVPFGAALFRDGQVKFVWYGQPGQHLEKPLQAIPFIRRALQTQAESGTIVGSAVIYKRAHAQNTMPQLNIELEYQTGFAEVFATEFHLNPDQTIDWGRNQRQEYSARIFTATSPDTPAAPHTPQQG